MLYALFLPFILTLNVGVTEPLYLSLLKFGFIELVSFPSFYTNIQIFLVMLYMSGPAKLVSFARPQATSNSNTPFTNGFNFRTERKLYV